ncbi:MAG: serine/threonine protein kinase [Deltaproteobacteria bacterium]|nr:serine/threonine protein kinase [Deltaproteobacteria bacterium]
MARLAFHPRGARSFGLPPEDDNHSLEGLVIERRYRVGRQVAITSSASVHEAISLKPARATHGKMHVALKFLSPGKARDADAVARFTHEAFLGTRFDHPSLVKVLDFGRLPDKQPYFAMALCRGLSMSRLLAESGPLSVPLAVSLLDDAADALSCLHEHGVVHRDIKPGNLFVTMSSGKWPRLKVLDLGVAGIFDAERAQALGIVDVGSRGTWGTPACLAPEQALGMPVDARADVYALACVAYRMLTGKEPFSGSSVESTVSKHLLSMPMAASQANPLLPEQVDGVLAWGMAKHRQYRIPTARALVAELRDALH